MIVCKIPPDKSLVISEPFWYPTSCVYHKKPIRTKFQAIKKNNGAINEPPVANEAAIAPRIGRTVNQNTGSPIPDNGHIIPTLTP